ncbi:hypothetical protein NL676_007214 [Syzygium grande]|nr:hypothetical protein NL676_007214 [Syzygium grande]
MHGAQEILSRIINFQELLGHASLFIINLRSPTTIGSSHLNLREQSREYKEGVVAFSWDSLSISSMNPYLSLSSVTDCHRRPLPQHHQLRSHRKKCSVRPYFPANVIVSAGFSFSLR